jgi:hypothetical protein
MALLDLRAAIAQGLYEFNTLQIGDSQWTISTSMFGMQVGTSWAAAFYEKRRYVRIGVVEAKTTPPGLNFSSNPPREFSWTSWCAEVARILE